LTAVASTKRPRGRPHKTEDQRDSGNRRLVLLSAAARLFRKQGFDATSTRDIAAAVGMHSGSPFYHFKSKGALLYAVMAEGNSRVWRHLGGSTAPGPAEATDARSL
jgi:AcrR family transcriptional regulator